MLGTDIRGIMAEEEEVQRRRQALKSLLSMRNRQLRESLEQRIKRAKTSGDWMQLSREDEPWRVVGGKPEPLFFVEHRIGECRETLQRRHNGSGQRSAGQMERCVQPCRDFAIYHADHDFRPGKIERALVALQRKRRFGRLGRTSHRGKRRDARENPIEFLAG